MIFISIMKRRRVVYLTKMVQRGALPQGAKPTPPCGVGLKCSIAVLAITWTDSQCDYFQMGEDNVYFTNELSPTAGRPAGCHLRRVWTGFPNMHSTEIF
ncbi:MAG: hypothetical protein ACP5I8_16400 [Phycisphaerae bacterium]